MKFGHGNRVLVLGASGFIGSHLCRALVNSGYVVRGMDRSNPNPSICLESHFQADFQEIPALKAALENIDVVIHLISTTLPASSNRDPVYDVQSNLVGTLNLMNLVKDTGVKLIFASSGGTVYGRQVDIPIKEDAETFPLCSYGVTKLAIERYLYMYNKLYGLDFRILRLANPYGDGQSPGRGQGVIANYMDKMLRNEKLEIWGDGEVVRDYIHIDDVVDLFVKVVKYNGEYRLFNVGTGIGYSLNQVVRVLSEVFSRELDVEYLPGRSLDVKQNVLDIRLAKRLLDWNPTFELKRGIEVTLEWYKNNYHLSPQVKLHHGDVLYGRKG